MNKAFSDLSRALQMYPLWIHQAYHTLAAKYKRTALGSLWIAGHFLIVSISITIVWGEIFRSDLKAFLAHAMLGNLCGALCLTLIADGPELFIGYSGLIRNYAYPYMYFAFEEYARHFMLFFHNLIVFFIIMIIMGTFTVPHYTIILGLLLNVTSLVTWSTIIGMFSARYRDLRFLLPSLSFLLFMLTPIYWNVSMLSEERRWIADFNPLNGMVSVLREPLLGHAPTAVNWISAGLVALTGTIAWLLLFPPFRRRIPFWV